MITILIECEYCHVIVNNVVNDFTCIPCSKNGIVNNVINNFTYSKKSKNGSNEVKNVNKIIEHLNNRTLLGSRLIEYLNSNLNIQFDKAESRKNSRKCHYDFIIYDTNGNSYNVEHKGSCKIKKIQRHDKPWKSGVQYANLGAEKFKISRMYGELWYNEYIKSGELSRVYKIDSKIPTFNTWFKRDCCTQGDPRTLFGIELKKKYRDEYGHKSSLLTYREKINKLFLTKIKENHKFLDDLTPDVLSKSNDVMKEKDLWLQINGDIFNDDPYKICFKWYPKIVFDTLELKECNSKSDIDIYFNGIQGKVTWEILAKLRWGKGAGFSNLRIDLK